METEAKTCVHCNQKPKRLYFNDAVKGATAFRRLRCDCGKSSCGMNVSWENLIRHWNRDVAEHEKVEVFRSLGQPFQFIDNGEIQ